jgi:transposase
VPRLSIPELTQYERADISVLPRKELEDLAWRFRELACTLANRLGEDSTTSSRPPSSDDPYRRDQRNGKPPTGQDHDNGEGQDGAAPAGKVKDEAGKAKDEAGKDKTPAKPPGKRPGMPGHWRRQPIVVSREIEHLPMVCEACQAVLGAERKRRHVSAHHVFELDRGEMGLQVTAAKHSYFAASCACGHETVASPGVGLRSQIEGRKRDLQLSERCLVGPMLAIFIAALALRFRLSRLKTREFLLDWLGLELGVATINRCIHEFGRASEPVVEELIEDIRASEVVHLDETPWYQQGILLWLWVAVNASTVVYRIGSRRKENLVALIGHAFLGWMVTDGYMAYRDHPRRQRCLAHLIRKALALAEGYYGPGSAFGRDLVRDLRRLIERVRDGDNDAAVKRLLARIKLNCRRNEHEIEQKVRALAREILNDWEAVIAFVAEPLLPPTNNDAERALRHAVIARRISFGTRTDEGSRFYAAGLSVIDTCRKRGVDPWTYGRDLIAAARKGSSLPSIPATVAA